MRSMKTLGLTLIAALALGAAAASAASAAEFTAAEYPASIVGQSTVYTDFGTEGYDIECSAASFDGTLGSASEVLDLSPSYTGCHLNLGILGKPTATFAMHGCRYAFHTAGTLAIAPAGCGPITVEALGCVISIPSQSGLGSVAYANDEGHVNVNQDLGGIRFTTNGECFGLLPTSGGHLQSTGAETFAGFNEFEESDGLLIG